MFPVRFRIIGPYLASYLHGRIPRPPMGELVKYLTQPAKVQRAGAFILGRTPVGEYWDIRFREFPDEPFYYRADLTWESFCQTVDECFDRSHWHHFLSGPISLTAEDVVVDAGAAEGLFTFIAARTARKVYAVEPVPKYIAALERNFAGNDRVEILRYAVGDRAGEARMSSNELASQVSGTGDLEIQIRPLDEIIPAEQRVTLLKGDVEGYEFPMLLGARGLIKKWRPRIVLAVYHRENCVDEITGFLRSIHPDYQFITRGLSDTGNPVILQVW